MLSFLLALGAMAGCEMPQGLTVTSHDGLSDFRCETVPSDEGRYSIVSKHRDGAHSSIRLDGGAERIAVSAAGDRLAVALQSNVHQHEYDIAILDSETLQVTHRWRLESASPRIYEGLDRYNVGPSFLERIEFTGDGRSLIALHSLLLQTRIGYTTNGQILKTVCRMDAATGRIRPRLLLQGPSDDSRPSMQSAPPGWVLDEHRMGKVKASSMKDLVELMGRLKHAYTADGRSISLSPGIFSSKRTSGYLHPPQQVLVDWRNSPATSKSRRTDAYKVLWDRCFNSTRTKLACWDWTNRTHTTANVLVWDLANGALESVTPIEGSIRGITFDDSRHAFRLAIEGQPVRHVPVGSQTAALPIASSKFDRKKSAGKNGYDRVAMSHSQQPEMSLVAAEKTIGQGPHLDSSVMCTAAASERVPMVLIPFSFPW